MAAEMTSKNCYVKRFCWLVEKKTNRKTAQNISLTLYTTVNTQTSSDHCSSVSEYSALHQKMKTLIRTMFKKRSGGGGGAEWKKTEGIWTKWTHTEKAEAARPNGWRAAWIMHETEMALKTDARYKMNCLAKRTILSLMKIRAFSSAKCLFKVCAML